VVHRADTYMATDPDDSKHILEPLRKSDAPPGDEEPARKHL
jgi:hypothetical protein